MQISQGRKHICKLFFFCETFISYAMYKLQPFISDRIQYASRDPRIGGLVRFFIIPSSGKFEQFKMKLNNWGKQC